MQISDYISHVLYQKYYQYNFPDKLPALGSEFSIEHYKKQANEIVKIKETLFIFTDSFYSDILDGIPDYDAANLLFDGSSAFFYSFASPESKLAGYGRLWLYFAAVLILFLPFLLFNFSFGTVRKNSATVTDIRRSKKYA